MAARASRYLARNRDGKLYAYSVPPDKDEENGLWWNQPGTPKVWIPDLAEEYTGVHWEDAEATVMPEEPQAMAEPEAHETEEQEMAEHAIEQEHAVPAPAEAALTPEKVLETFLPRVEDGYAGHLLAVALGNLLIYTETGELECVKRAQRSLEQLVSYKEA